MELVRVGLSHFRGTVLDLIEVDFEFDVDQSGAVVGGRSSFGFNVDETFERMSVPVLTQAARARHPISAHQPHRPLERRTPTHHRQLDAGPIKVDGQRRSRLRPERELPIA